MTRYQVFISSTFLDLAEERAAVFNMVLSLDHIPAGMELFPASPETPWELIKHVIDLSDYYIVVVGGKYGSTTDDGLSFTEREYDYAVDQRKFVIAFVHEDRGTLPSDRIELETKRRKQLDRFIAKLKRAHTIKHWNSPADLAGKVSQSLSLAIASSPAVGWVRADGIDATELLKKNANLHEEISRLRHEIDSLRASQLREANSNRMLADVADQLGKYGREWFLRKSGDDLQQPFDSLQSGETEIANWLIGNGMMFTDEEARSLKISQYGWDLRDELLRREMLLHMLDSAPMDRQALVGLWCDEDEGDKVLRELAARNYIGHDDEPNHLVLTSVGQVAAQRIVH
jgi:hypothetical protein